MGLPLLLLAALSTWAPTASAEPSPQQIKAAAEAFDLGVKAAKAGDLEAAASHFETADREAPSPEALRAAIRARRDAKQNARAATLAAQALTRYPAETDLVVFAKGLIDQMGSKLHKVSVSCTPECVLVVDRKLVPGEATRKSTLYLDPGQHTISAGFGAKNASQEVTAAEGGSSEASFTEPKKADAAPAAVASAPPPKASAEPPAPEPSSTSTDKAKKGGLPPAVAIAGLGITAVLAGVTTWSGIDTQSNPGPDKVKQECVNKGTSCQLYQDGLSKQKRTNVLIGVTVGAALVSTTIALFLTDWGGSSSAPAKGQGPRVLPGVAIDGQGATLSATGQF